MFSKNNYFNTNSEKRFYNPTFVVSGDNVISKIPDLLTVSVPRILVLDARLSIPEIFSEVKFDRVIKVFSEPDEATVTKEISQLNFSNYNLVAIGGGSTIDFAKAIWINSMFGTWKAFGYHETRFSSDLIVTKPGNFIAIPTTTATGSEVSRYFLIKDKITNKKVVSRSWYACPDYAFLDPTLLIGLSNKMLVSFAFDAFIHCWETYFCRYESSAMVKLLAKEGIAKILTTISYISTNKDLAQEDLADLQYAGYLGGLCLSNTRTGILHTTGELFSEQVQLAHPLTLYVFFEKNLLKLKNEIEDDFQKLIKSSNFEFESIESIIEFWKIKFTEFELIDEIKEGINKSKIDKERILIDLLKDKVLIDKEHPVSLTESEIKEFIHSSIETFIA